MRNTNNWVSFKSPYAIRINSCKKNVNLWYILAKQSCASHCSSMNKELSIPHNSKWDLRFQIYILTKKTKIRKEKLKVKIEAETVIFREQRSFWKLRSLNNSNLTCYNKFYARIHQAGVESLPIPVFPQHVLSSLPHASKNNNSTGKDPWREVPAWNV